MNLVALDPSYRGFGIAYYRSEDKLLSVQEFSIDIVDRKYLSCLRAALDMSSKVSSFLLDALGTIDFVLIEEPLISNVVFSSGLSLLSACVVKEMIPLCHAGPSHITFHHPAYIRKFKAKDAPKKATVEFVRVQALPVLKCYPFILDIPDKITHNQADALIYLLRLFYCVGEDVLKTIAIQVNENFKIGELRYLLEEV